MIRNGYIPLDEVDFSVFRGVVVVVGAFEVVEYSGVEG